jgi:hypothetical protein
LSAGDGFFNHRLKFNLKLGKGKAYKIVWVQADEDLAYCKKSGNKQTIKKIKDLLYCLEFGLKGSIKNIISL